MGEKEREERRRKRRDKDGETIINWKTGDGLL